MGDFAELLGRLDQFQKASQPDCDDDDDKKKPMKAASDKDSDSADDKKISAAAKDGEKQSDKDKDEDNTFGKAFKVKLEDGSEAEAFDGTAMLKALHADNESLRATIDEQNQQLAKAMDIVVTELQARREHAGEQATLIKALQTKLDAVSSAGVGRKTMLAIAEKLTPGASPDPAEKPKATSGQVLMKAQFLAREGKLDWGALPRIEAFQGRGELAPADLLARFPELLTPVP